MSGFKETPLIVAAGPFGEAKLSEVINSQGVQWHLDTQRLNGPWWSVSGKSYGTLEKAREDFEQEALKLGPCVYQHFTEGEHA